MVAQARMTVAELENVPPVGVIVGVATTGRAMMKSALVVASPSLLVEA